MQSLKTFIAATAMLSLAATQGFAHSNGSADEKAKDAFVTKDLFVKTTKIREGIYMLRGNRSAGNIAVSIGDDGTFMIDAQFAQSAPEIMKAVTELGGSSPKFIINTHYHPDHTDGNKPFSDAGAIIAAHENVRTQLKVGTKITILKQNIPAVPESQLPVITFPEEMNLHLNGDRVVMTHYPRGHTEGDVIIHLEDSNVILMGDIWNNSGNYPFIDSEHGGTLAGVIAAQRAIVEIADDNTVIIPGHGSRGGKAELKAYVERLTRIYNELLEHAKKGHTLEQVIAARPVSKIGEDFGTGILNQTMWLTAIYPTVQETM